VPNRPQEITEATTPGDGAATTPDISASAAQLRVIVGHLQKNLQETRGDVKDIKTEFRWLMAGFAVGFLALGGMFIAGYLRLEDRIDPVTISTTRIETKLDDLLARIPPAVTPVPKR
jgi:hypothetical protein